MPKFRCSICRKKYEGYGNNAQPINNKRCCDRCNTLIVIPKRMEIYMNGKEK